MTDDSDILEFLGSLATVNCIDGKQFVKLFHFTLYEFLGSETLRTHGPLSKFHVSGEDTFQVGLTCIRYLSFSDFKEPCKSREELTERVSSCQFLTFAATNWINFSRVLVGRGPGIRKILPCMKWFLEPCRDGNLNFRSWQQVYHDVVDCSGLTTNPLSYAVDFGMVNLFDILLQRGADPEVLYQKGYSGLHIAATRGYEDGMATILQTKPELETRCYGGLTALHLAAGYGHVGCVRLLLGVGASPEARSKSRTTPFYRAARSGSIPTLELLYATGCNINAKTWDGWMPIFEAIEESHIDVVRWLVKRGAKLDHETKFGLSVLEYARTRGHKDVIQIIEEGLSYTK